MSMCSRRLSPILLGSEEFMLKAVEIDPRTISMAGFNLKRDQAFLKNVMEKTQGGHFNI